MAMSVGRRIAVTCAVFGFVLAALAPGAGATATSFSYTGAAQSWTVPAGVSQAVFDLYGAQGTTLDSCKDTAKGAHVTAAIAVVPGETLRVLVGGQAGFNGGSPSSVPGGGGSDVRRGPGFALTDRLLVAGGGGGGAVPGACTIGAGGASASPGRSGFDQGTTGGGFGGQPGTASAGGKGGTGGSGNAPGAGGADGALGQGGNGGGEGGGGGGGYFGGGGGGGGGFDPVTGDHAGGGGGGGGSSFVGSATGATVTDGVRAGDGLVVVTYTSSAGGGTTPSAGGGTTFPPPSKATISSLGETNSVFVVGHASTPLTGRTAAKRHKQGTGFFFRLDQPATMKIAIQTKARGRRVGRICKPDSRRLRHKPRCTRTITIATLTRTAHAGLSRVAFTGRIRGRALKPGRYTAVFTAIDAAGASRPLSLGFTIVPR